MSNRRKLVIAEEARVVGRQPVAPCSDCPWARDALPGWLGSLSIDDWLRAAHTDGPMECHTMKGEGGEHWECAGAAIYRANVAKLARERRIALAADRSRVFASPTEFRKHHEKGPKVKPWER